MSKIFEYTKATRQYYLENSDEYEYEGETIYYEPDEEVLQDEVIDLLFDTYFSEKIIDSFSTDQRVAIKQAFRNFINDNDSWEDLYDDFEEELEAIFEEEAFEMYN